MTREEALEHIWELSDSVKGEFCRTPEQRQELDEKTADALCVLGATNDEIWGD